MKKFAFLVLALSLSVGTSVALAESVKPTDLHPAKSSRPVKMTDDQLDNVTAGLITIIAVDVVDINNNNVLNEAQVLNNINVAANAAIAVLGNAVANGRFRNQQEVSR